MKLGASYGNIEVINRETVALLVVMLVLLVNVKSTKDKHSASSLIRLECPVADTWGRPLSGKHSKMRVRSYWKLEGKTQPRDDLIQVFTNVPHLGSPLNVSLSSSTKCTSSRSSGLYGTNLSISSTDLVLTTLFLSTNLPVEGRATQRCCPRLRPLHQPPNSPFNSRALRKVLWLSHSHLLMLLRTPPSTFIDLNYDQLS